MRYLDPKNDLVFKRVFGEHPHILKSFLNGLLPLEEDQEIVSLEYLPTELVPELPEILKNTLVDVRCIDNSGRQFLVEMQMLWTDSFKSRVLFNASKAYIRQLDRGVKYIGLQPVYALSIVNQNFEKQSDVWYHHYKMVHLTNPEMTIDGLQLIFVELPKFKAHNFREKKLSVLWLRYLFELENLPEMISEDLKSVPEIAEAIELSKESAYTKAQLEAYDKYWDHISIEKTFIADAEARGEKRGEARGEARGKLQGEIEGKTLVVINCFNKGFDIDTIADITSLREDDVKKILNEKGLI